MKELLEELYTYAIMNSNEVNSSGDFIAFEQWYEQNKSKIDDAIGQYLKSLHKPLYSAFSMVKLTKQYDYCYYC